MNAIDTARSNMANRLRADAAELDRQRSMDAAAIRWAGFVKVGRRIDKASKAAPYDDGVYNDLRSASLKALRAAQAEHRKLTAAAKQTDYRPPGFPADAEPEVADS